MFDGIELLAEEGCSDKFVQIIKKYDNLKTSEKDLRKFIQDIEEYKKNTNIASLEQDIFNEAKKIYENIYIDSTKPESIAGDVDVIGIIEKDYNGDTFTADGYEFNTDDNRRY